MTIDNAKVNKKHVGAFINASHGAANFLDDTGKQRGFTSRYYFEGDRDAAFPVIDFILAYIGNHGDIQPIKTFEFDLIDHAGAPAQHVIMKNCVITKWSLESPEQPGIDVDGAGDEGRDHAPARPDVERVRIESTDVVLQSGGDTKPFIRTDPNKAA